MGTLVVKSHPVDQSTIRRDPETARAGISSLGQGRNRTYLNKRKTKGVKLPVNLGILVKSGCKSHGIGEGHSKEVGIQRAVPDMEGPVKEPSDSRYSKGYTQETNQQGMNGFGG